MPAYALQLSDRVQYVVYKPILIKDLNLMENLRLVVNVVSNLVSTLQFFFSRLNFKGVNFKTLR